MSQEKANEVRASTLPAHGPLDENGRETLLKHFSREAQYTCPQKEMEGKEIRISIRNAVDLEQEIVTAIQK